MINILKFQKELENGISCEFTNNRDDAIFYFKGQEILNTSKSVNVYLYRDINDVKKHFIKDVCVCMSFNFSEIDNNELVTIFAKITSIMRDEKINNIIWRGV
jgi:hypothetical protein